MKSFWLKELIALIYYYKIRLSLALVGLTLGLLSLFVLFSLQYSVNVHMQKTFSDFSDTHFVAQVIPGSYNAMQTLKDKLGFPNIRTLENHPIEHMQIYPFHSDHQQVLWGEDSIQTNLVFMPLEMIQTLGMSIDRGRTLHALDNSLKVVLIGQDWVKRLEQKGFNPIGESLQINGRYYEVVGTVEENEVSPILDFNLNKSIIMDYSLAPVFGYELFLNYYVQSEESMAQAQAELKRLFQYHFDAPTIFFRDSQLYIKAMFGQVQLTQKILKLVALLNLSLGLLALINMLCLLVEDRAQEIGIKICVGASKVQIILLFMRESVALCLLGGMIGIVLGAPTAYLLISRLDVACKINWIYNLSILPIALLMGILAGILPAFLAAQKNPVQLLNQ
tara:strand:+ start:48777 stop:49952 length:1176 start_codon:yes stop_codon:yes gene_type:complete